jgi:hypothetical protein
MHAAGGLPAGAGGDEEHDEAGVRGTPQKVMHGGMEVNAFGGGRKGINK